MSNVVDFGAFRISQREGKRSWSYRDERCSHHHLTLDDNGHIVRCDDCKEVVSAYWAIQMLAEVYNKAVRKVDAARQQVAEDKAHNIHLTAAKRVEKVWRSKNMVPCCPHCGRGIRPDDGLGHTQINRSIDERIRAIKKANPTTGNDGAGHG